MNDDHERPVDGRDDIATLVRLAGKRQSVPPDRAARVRAAARAEWQHEVQQRSRKRYAWTAAGLAAAASLVLAITFRVLPIGTGAPTGPDAPILVEALTGPAWSRATVAGENPARRTLRPGDDLHAGSDLITAEGSRAAVRLASGHSLRLDAATTVRLLDGGSLALERGAIYVDSGIEADTAGALRVHTPLGVIEEIGTQFEVRLDDDSVRVRLREGAVVMHHDDRAHEVRVGTEMTMSLDGSVMRRSIATHGTEWEWIVGITPSIDLEGRSARAFLDWVARERGWTLAFADESVGRSAGEIVLAGTVERLTLEEALDAVLPTCRMTYRIEQGVLIIAAAPSDPGA